MKKETKAEKMEKIIKEFMESNPDFIPNMQVWTQEDEQGDGEWNG